MSTTAGKYTQQAEDVKVPLEERITAAVMGRTIDIEQNIQTLERVCRMSIEDYILCIGGDTASRRMRRLTKCLGISSYEICNMCFGEVCLAISQKWEETFDGTSPGKQVLEALELLLPAKIEEK